jgi:hypothetical protein
MTLIRDLFASDVTRPIPPVVYFHEQSPKKLADEVSEYIITGGWPSTHPNHRRVPDGIHEQYVRLLRAITAELDRDGGPDLPTAWISGFYGSGKSSFAKLLGLALDGVAVEGGGSMSEAWLRRDTSPKQQELRDAWTALRQKIDPIAAVFDVGACARDNEHIHSVAVRQVQKRLGYCPVDLVADFELKLERDGLWPRFQQVAQQVLGRPWAEMKDSALAEDHFSHVLSVFDPVRYPDAGSWFAARAGTLTRSESPEEAVGAVRDMIRFRSPDTTLFLVVDEVSQYVLTSKDRVDRLRAFATALGSTLKGRVWLLALGQQKLDEQADDTFLKWAKDRFPERLRVHLAATNIRDVVHKRLLQKKPPAEQRLRDLFEAHRSDLKLFAYGCENVTAEDFVEVYPLLPGHIDLLLQITTALRTRSTRVQGDSHAIRGLLQLLGSLFVGQGLADAPLGALVTLEHIYEVQHTALDSDVQASMARILGQCVTDESGLLVRVAKVVALLEQIQETLPTDAKLVSSCLYDRLDRGSQLTQVTDALEELRRRNLLGYSEKTGYKIQSSAAEEWEGERRDINIARETIGETIQDALKYLMGTPDLPKLDTRPFKWAATFSDGRRFDDAIVLDPRVEAPIRVDFRMLPQEERGDAAWIRRSDEAALQDRLVWVCGSPEAMEQVAREYARSKAMVARFEPRRESLNAARKLLLQQEKNRAEDDLQPALYAAVAASWMAGRFYFRGAPYTPIDHGAAFGTSLHAVGARALPTIYRHFVGTEVLPAELMLFMDDVLTAPPVKFLTDGASGLGILDLDQGRYVPACSGVVPRRVQEYIDAEGGVAGVTLLARFCGPPYGYTVNVVKACVAGLLRAGRVKLAAEGGVEITATRDAGARDLFAADRSFRRATLHPAGTDDIGFPARTRICRLFEDSFGHKMDREDNAIADAVATLFPHQAARLRGVMTSLGRLPGSPPPPLVLARLGDAIEACLRTCRQTKPTVQAVKRHLDALRDGFQLVHLFEAELTPEAIAAVRDAAEVRDHHAAQLAATQTLPPEAAAAVEHVVTHLVTERPWRDVASLAPHLAAIRAAYVAVRTERLAWQEQQAGSARARVKARPGFSTLTGEQSHTVLRPLAQAMTDTTAEAIAPPLSALEDVFLVRLQRAEVDANERLDEILSEGKSPPIRTVDTRLKNREITNEAELDAVLAELRGRVMEQLRAGARIRLV